MLRWYARDVSWSLGVNCVRGIAELVVESSGVACGAGSFEINEHKMDIGWVRCGAAEFADVRVGAVDFAAPLRGFAGVVECGSYVVKEGHGEVQGCQLGQYGVDTGPEVVELWAVPDDVV